MAAKTPKVSINVPLPLYGGNSGGNKRTMNFSKGVFIYLLGGLVGTIWETIWNFMNGNGFVFLQRQSFHSL